MSEREDARKKTRGPCSNDIGLLRWFSCVSFVSMVRASTPRTMEKEAMEKVLLLSTLVLSPHKTTNPLSSTRFAHTYKTFFLRSSAAPHKSVVSLLAKSLLNKPLSRIYLAAKCNVSTPSPVCARFVKSGTTSLRRTFKVASCALHLRTTTINEETQRYA